MFRLAVAQGRGQERGSREQETRCRGSGRGSTGENTEAGLCREPRRCAPEGAGPDGGQALAHPKAPWEALSAGAGRLLTDPPVEDQASAEHIVQSCAKPQICINSVSLEPPTLGLTGGGTEGLFDFLTSPCSAWSPGNSWGVFELEPRRPGSATRKGLSEPNAQLMCAHGGFCSLD